MDPKPLTSIGDYACFANNPILFNDPLGDKVKLTKDKEVSRKEFRQMKRNIRELRRNSETFATMYNDLDRRKETYYYKATKSEGGDSKDPFIIKIGVNYTGNDDEHNGKEPKQFAQLGMIAHETGHKIRELYNADPQFPEVGNSTNDEYIQQFQYAHQVSELGALHIENIVRGELQKVKKYSKININQYYSPGFKIETSKTINGKTYKTLGLINNYDLFKFRENTKETYKIKTNIYEELYDDSRKF